MILKMFNKLKCLVLILPLVFIFTLGKSYSADTTNPEIVILSPAEGDFVEATLTVKATIYDDVKVDTSTIIVKLDNVNVTGFVYSTSTQILEYKITTPLSNGEHEVIISVKDTSGNGGDEYAVTVMFKVETQSVKIENFICYPNPFETELGVSFSISKKAEVNIKIFTISGELVKNIKILESEINVGANTKKWDCRNEQNNIIARGIYFCQLLIKSSGNVSLTNNIKKIAKIK